MASLVNRNVKKAQMQVCLLKYVLLLKCQFYRGIYGDSFLVNVNKWDKSTTLLKILYCKNTCNLLWFFFFLSFFRLMISWCPQTASWWTSCGCCSNSVWRSSWIQWILSTSSTPSVGWMSARKRPGSKPRWRTWRAGSLSCVSVGSVLGQENCFRCSVWLQTSHLLFLPFLHRWRPVQVLRAQVPYRMLLLNATSTSSVHPPVLSALHTEAEGHQGSEQVLCTDSDVKTNNLLPKPCWVTVHCEVNSAIG